MGVCKTVEARGEYPVERVHQYLDRVLQLILQEGLGIVARLPSRDQGGLVDLPALHQLLEQVGDQPDPLVLGQVASLGRG